MSLKSKLKLILSGYAEKGRSAGIFFLFIAGSLAAGGVIVFPLWKFSTTYPKLYSLCLLGLTALLLLIYLISRAAKKGREKVINTDSTAALRRNRWINGGKWLFTIVSVYILILQFTSGSWLLGIIISILLFFILGWIWFGKPDGRPYSTR